MRPERAVLTTTRGGRRLLFVLSVLTALLFSQAATAQSGRGRGKSTTAPLPPVASEPKAETTASPEAVPAPANKPAPAATIIVGGDRLGSSSYFLSGYIQEVINSCIGKLRNERALEVIGAGHMTRVDAVERAKKEQEAYVLWLDIKVEDDAQNTVAINYYVFKPQTAKNFTSGNVYLGTRRVGSGTVGVGVPTVTRRLPIEQQMREGGEQVAARVLSKFRL